jgi:hypothetical protein
MLEKDIEARGVRAAKERGQTQYKFTSMNRAAVPDRLALAYIEPEHREIVSKYIRFVEYKRTGQQPTPAQLREHKRLQSMGYTVEVVDNLDDAKRVTREMNRASSE